MDALIPAFSGDSNTVISPWTYADISGNASCNALTSRPQSGDVQLSKDDILAEIWRSFAQIYERYPLWHFETLIARVENEDFLTDGDLRSLLLCFYLMNDITAFRRNPAHGIVGIERMVEIVESSRPRSQQMHFAESPSLDAVIVSLVLFIAYSVWDRHQVAFYYLNEAVGLWRLIDEDSLDSVHRALYHRLDCILFVTESASMPIYGDAQRPRSTRLPEGLDSLEASMRWYVDTEKPTFSLPAEFAHLNLATLDNHAIEMLQSLVRIYGAETAREISQTVPTAGDIIEEGGMGDISVQEADVDITRQWQLCIRWQEVLTARKPTWPPRCAPSTLYTLQVIGLAALQHCGALSTEGYRLIGPGKLAALVVSISSVASQLGVATGCSSIIGDMLRIVARADFERHFAPQMSEIELSVQGLLRPMALLNQDSPARLWLAEGEDEDWQRGTTDQHALQGEEI